MLVFHADNFSKHFAVFSRFSGMKVYGAGKNERGGLEIYTWVFPNIGVPQNGWFTMENPITMDDLGVPLFLERPTYHIDIKMIFPCESLPSKRKKSATSLLYYVVLTYLHLLQHFEDKSSRKHCGTRRLSVAQNRRSQFFLSLALLKA